MRHTSKDERFFYYDRVLFKWQSVDSDMLFLLGFEAVLSYHQSISDTLIIPAKLYNKELGKYIPLIKFEIYDGIYDYLSNTGCIEDHDDYLLSNMYGLKLSINDMSGTGYDRTIPLIFKSDINNHAIDLTQPMLRLPTIHRDSLSYFDLQAQKIIDLFADSDFAGKGADPLSIERRNNSQIYKLLDYKSMYAYSLGVLYGCRCLGFDPKLIWRVDPQIWYTGDSLNLVRTAWHTFIFHYTQSSDEDRKYRDIHHNSLWDLESLSDDSIDYIISAPIRYNSSLSIKLSIVSDDSGNRSISSHLVLYDSRLDEYLDLSKDSLVWSEISSLATSEGIVPFNSDSKIVRYSNNNDKIIILKAYDRTGAKSDTGDNLQYFVSSNNIGWVSNIDSVI